MPKYTIEDCHAIASTHPEGKCLDKTYSGNVEWYCGIHDHSWYAQPCDVIKRGKWCAECGKERTKEKLRKKGVLKECQRVAKERGGACLSEEYINAKTPLEWICQNGHDWEAPSDDVLRKGTWCQECNLIYAREEKEKKRLSSFSN